jgi:hypothetical protein
VIEIDKALQKKVVTEVARSMLKALEERVNQRMPGHSAEEKLQMKRSIVSHLLANLLLDASREEIANYGDLVGALINMTNEARRQRTAAAPPEEPVG